MAGRPVYDWSPGKVLTQVEVAFYAYMAGFRGDDLWKAVAIAGRESGYKPGIHGSDAPKASVSGDRGLFQINYIHDERLIQEGLIKSKTDLFDPLTNARVAFNLYQRSGNSFAPAWSVGEGGWNGTGDPLTGTSRYQDGARAAAAQVAANPNAAVPAGTPTRNYGVGDALDDTLDMFGKPVDAVTGLIPGLDGLGNIAAALVSFARVLLDIRTWVRVLYALGGVALIGLGLFTMVGPEAAKVGSNFTGAGALVNAAA